MDFLLEITKIRQKSLDFWFTDFFLEIYGMDFPMRFFVILMLFFKSTIQRDGSGRN